MATHLVKILSQNGTLEFPAPLAHFSGPKAARAGAGPGRGFAESLSPLDLTLPPPTHPPKIATPPLRGDDMYMYKQNRGGADEG